jgi:hypothetical protein
MRSRALSRYAILALVLMLGVLAGCSKKPGPSDAQIASDVQNKIYSDPWVQSRQIAVLAASGVVTLSGSATSDGERAAAANDAATINGVRTVVNNLRVQQTQVNPPVPAQPQPTTQREKKSPKLLSKPDQQIAANGMAQNGVNEGPGNPQADNPPSPPSAPALQTPPTPPPPPPPPQKILIAAGTQLTVRLNDPLDSERNQVGDTFHCSLGAPISIDGETVIPAGADVVGRVADVKSAGRFAGNSVLTLELKSLSVNGRTYNIQTNQWSRAGKGEGKSTATKVGVGTAAGAVLGGIIGGGKGAAIGAAAGAGTGTGVAASKRGEQIKLGPEAVLNFQIINPLTVTPQGTSDRNAGRPPLS